MKQDCRFEHKKDEEFRFGRALGQANVRFRRLGDLNLSRHGINISQLRILGYLARNEEKGEIYQKDLEEAFGVRRSSVTSILQNMEKSGYLVRESSQRDARVKRVVLTQKGRELDQTLLRYIHSLEEEMLSGFSPEEKASLQGYLVRIISNLENIEGGKV